MPGLFHHEEHYRGREAVATLAGLPVTLCGAGALGSNLADTLVRQGVRRLRVIDRDRIEAHNVGTQLYGEGDVGSRKVDVLRARLFQAAGVEIEALGQELSERTIRKLLPPKRLASGEVVIDTFDNSASRRLVQEACRASGAACLHVGLFADYGEAVWDEHYRVPEDVAGDVCDYPLARNLVLLTVAVAAETLLRHALEGRRESWSVTLRDFAIHPLPPAG
jgi:molybdopterin/thiamine biosynthesis adenylyltransferase